MLSPLLLHKSGIIYTYCYQSLSITWLLQTSPQNSLLCLTIDSPLSDSPHLWLNFFSHFGALPNFLHYITLLFSAVLCTTVVHSYKHTHIWAVLTGVLATRDCWWFRFSWGFSVSFCLFYLPKASLFVFQCIVLCCQYQCKWLPVKTRLWNDLWCVEQDIKLYSLTH